MTEHVPTFFLAPLEAAPVTQGGARVHVLGDVLVGFLLDVIFELFAKLFFHLPAAKKRAQPKGYGVEPVFDAYGVLCLEWHISAR